jgi:hypothetical protein
METSPSELAFENQVLADEFLDPIHPPGINGLQARPGETFSEHCPVAGRLRVKFGSGQRVSLLCELARLPVLSNLGARSRAVLNYDGIILTFTL